MHVAVLDSLGFWRMGSGEKGWPWRRKYNIFTMHFLGEAELLLVVVVEGGDREVKLPFLTSHG